MLKREDVSHKPIVGIKENKLGIYLAYSILKSAAMLYEKIIPNMQYCHAVTGPGFQFGGGSQNWQSRHLAVRQNAHMENSWH